MFFHEFLYKIKRVLRQKEELFWVLLFPMILGTMFYFAFSNLNNTTENFHTIPAAVCYEEGTNNQSFQQVLRTLSQESDTPFLSITETDWDSAVQLLKNNTVRGIFRVGEEVSLTCVSADEANVNNTLAMEQSILEAFLREYEAGAKAVPDALMQAPDALDDVLALAKAGASYGSSLTLTDGNMDSIVQYFYNLIAMACLFTSFAGTYVAIRNQANLSDVGARKCVSPSGKAVSVAAQLLSGVLTQFGCIVVNILYLVYVLRVDFGTALPLLLFTALIGCILGVSFGFFIGSIGQLSELVKNGILVCVSMLCCFFSGLMISGIRLVVEKFCPLFNDINPAVLVSDSFLTLNIYGPNRRYFGNLCSLLLMAALFIAAGCLMIRRKTYASL